MNCLFGKLMILIAFLSLILFGNGAILENDALMEENDMTNYREYIRMMADDTYGDHKSLIWDGSAMAETENRDDDAEILDGGLGEIYVGRYEARAGRIASPNSEELFSDEAILSDEPRLFAAHSKDRFVSVEVTDIPYEDCAAEHGERIEKGEAIGIPCDWLDDGVCEAGIYEVSEGDFMVGLKFFVKQKGGSTNIYTYAGTGIYAYIKGEALMFAKRTI